MTVIQTPFLAVFCLLFTLLPARKLQGQDYFFGTPLIENFGTEDFNGGIQSWDIMQDNREIIYVANNFGLLEFDGTTWNIYPVTNGTKVRSVHIGSDQKIYVGSQADFGYFSSNNTGGLTYHSLADSLPDQYRNFDEVWRIYEIEGRIYFFTFKNIFYFTPGEPLQVIKPDHPLEFSFQVNNKIYSLQWGMGLSVLENNKLKVLPNGEVFSHRSIASILPYDKNSLAIFTTSDGVYLYDGSEVSEFPLKDSILKDLVINQAILLKDGSFALGTQNNGLILINRNGELLLHVTRDKGLLDQTIHTVYQDAHENLWLGLNNGISMIELSTPFSLLDDTMGLSGTGYTALKKDSTLYLGTNNGLYSLQLDSAVQHFSLVPNSTGQVYQLRDIGGKILMGHHNGPYIIKNGLPHLIYPENGAWEFISVPNNPDKLILGYYTGLSLLSSTNEDIDLLWKYKGFDESSRVLEFDNEGNLWMAHGYKGIFKIRMDKGLKEIKTIDFYNSHDGFPSDQLINMEKINNKLIFPALYGIYTYQKETDKFVRDESFSALFNNNEHIVEMEQDILGNIYFISDQHVGRLSFDKFENAKMETRVFNRIRGMLNDDLSAIYIIDSENILFGAKQGFIHYNAAKPKKMQPFHTHLTKVVNTSGEMDSLMLEGKKINTARAVELPFDMNSVRFAYSSSFYENPEETVYQYKLKNFDNGWSEWSAKSEKEYTNLPEGSYEFLLRARNVYSTISGAVGFKFTIHPPFYRSRWAYFIYSLTGIFLAVTVFHQVDKRFKKEKRRILLNQERELSKKNTQIEQITSKSEREIVRLKNEKLQSEIDHINRELTSSTMHLINKNELLNNVKLGLTDILKKKDKAEHSDELKRIIKNINHNISADGDWKNFELHFNHVHGNFTNRLLEKHPKLTPQEIKLSAYLRLNLTTKEIAHLLNISVRGVEISRYRLRKKLELDRSENLTDFMLKF